MAFNGEIELRSDWEREGRAHNMDKKGESGVSLGKRMEDINSNSQEFEGNGTPLRRKEEDELLPRF